jgi:hypothetical protein
MRVIQSVGRVANQFGNLGDPLFRSNNRKRVSELQMNRVVGSELNTGSVNSSPDAPIVVLEIKVG